jgi:hypothetical protein
MTTSIALMVAIGLACGAPSAGWAETVEPTTEVVSEPFEPSFYLAALVGTTLGFHPQGGELDGPQSDLTPMAGVGVALRADLAVEIDLGPTFVSGEYVAFSLVPGVVWQFSSVVYASGRVIVPVDPEAGVALFPGLGAIHVFDNGLAPFVELNLYGNLAEARHDVGLALALGTLLNL